MGRRILIAIVLLAGLMAPVARAATGPALPLGPSDDGVHRLKHVFVIVLENTNYADAWGPASKAPYLSGILKPQGAFVPSYYGTGHASADNYIAMTSGQPPTPPFMGDCENWLTCVTTERAWPDGGKNITDQLNHAAPVLTWKAYMGSMKDKTGTRFDCVHPTETDTVDPYSAPYATRHNPFAYYPSVINDDNYCKDHVVNYENNFANDLTSLARPMPNYVFITPDTCDDGHDGGNPITPCTSGKQGGLQGADFWLSQNVQQILDSAAYHDNGALFITFDENGFSDPDCCNTSGAAGGHVGMLVLSPLLKTHASGVQLVSSVASDHYGFLRTVEDAFGISEHLNMADLAQPINDIWLTS